jgi:iron complex transport system ATP-binding protein
MPTLIDNVLYEALPYTFMGLALVLTFRYLKLIDLTFAASFVLGPAIMGQQLVAGRPLALALLLAALATLLLAVFTVALTQGLGVDSLLAGLLASFGGYAVALLFTQGTLSLSGVRTPFDRLKEADWAWAVDRVPLHPAQNSVLLLLAGGAVWATSRFLRSEAGLGYRALEDSRSADRLLRGVGLSPDRLRAGGVVCGNLLCMASGSLLALKEGQVTAQRGFDALVTTVAAFLLGSALFERRAMLAEQRGVTRWIARVQRLGPAGASLAGLLAYFALLFGVARFNVPASVPKLVVVALITVGFAASRWPELRSARRLRRGDRTVLIDAPAPLAAHGVSVSYPGSSRPRQVLADVALEARPGELLYLEGPNGSGKSTLLRYLAGLTPGRGTVAVPVGRGTSRGRFVSRAALVGYMAQDAGQATCEVLTAGEHLALYRAGARPHWFRRWDHARNLSDEDGSGGGGDDSRPVGTLSGGQRQIVGVSAFLVRREPPQVVLFDEPLTHLDDENAHGCIDAIGQLVQNGHAVVLVQHDLPPTSAPGSDPRARLSRMVTRRVHLEHVARRVGPSIHAAES